MTQFSGLVRDSCEWMIPILQFWLPQLPGKEVILR